MATSNNHFTNLEELIRVTDPLNENYVIQLYGNIFIHQKPGVITAYQTDRKGQLHFIADLISDCTVSQLSVSTDGRYFGFIANEVDLTTAYVYFLDTIDKSMEIAYSWSYENSQAPRLFFSQNGQFAIFSPCTEKLHIQPLYTDESEVIFEAPIGTQPSKLNYLVVAQGTDYIIWIQPHGHLKVIDLVAGQQPTEWLLGADDTALLPTKDSSCMFYNNYVIHINNASEQPETAAKAKITILAVNSISQTVKIVSEFSFPEIGGRTWCEVNSDGHSITLHNLHKNRDTRMSALLPEIITSFSD